MTKDVLLVGVLVTAFYILLWVVFTVLPVLPNTGIAFFDSILQTLRYFAAINGYHDSTPFAGTSPFYQVWFVCLVIAIVGDAVIKPAAKSAVSAFAASLAPDTGQDTCKVMQQTAWRGSMRTTTSGTFQGRRTTVLVFQRPRLSYLTLEMGCRLPWALDIRKRNLASRALAFLGAPIKTGHEALDEAVVLQGDDEVAIRKWACTAEVQTRILSLFQVCGITSLITATGPEEEPVLRAEYTPFRPRLFPLEHAVGILNSLAGLAASAEAATTQG